jgi:hypothetical protein
MSTKTLRNSLVGLALAAASITVSPSATAGDCYGCYDDAAGVEHCKTVQVQGACTVIAFCKVVGCNAGASRGPGILKAPTKPPVPPGPTAAGQFKAARPAGR